MKTEGSTAIVTAREAAASDRNLDPIPLSVFADYMRQETWLDMCVPDVGSVERVLIEQINVRRDRDEVMVMQTASGGLADMHTFDTEDVRWLRPTSVELEDVAPLRGKTTPLDATYEATLIAAIVDVICQRTSAVPEDVMAGDSGAHKALYERQEAMWCAFEMTNLRPETICTGYFKYRSVMPLVTLRDRLEWLTKKFPGVSTEYAERHIKDAALFKKWCRDTIKKVDRLGTKFRRSQDKYGDWPTIL